MATLFERIAQHLLPKGLAWRLTPEKTLKDFVNGLFAPLETFKDAWFDYIWLQIFPDVTDQLDEWERQFGLQTVAGASEQDRIDRLIATWQATGGQSPRYLQDTVRAAGFDVYIHEWWEPGSNPPTVRNPLLILNDESGQLNYLTVCGNAQAVCGYVGAVCGSSSNPKGYPLVNKILQVRPNVVDCGDPIAVCGNANAVCGAFTGFKFTQRRYTIPNDPNKWPYFLYWGGENFPDLADIPQSRRNEFETLVLKLCPTEQWLGILVNYT